MKSSDQLKARALKLSDVLGGMGHDVEHSAALDVISKLEGDPDWNSNAENISKDRLIAEQYLSEMIEAKSELDYQKFLRRMDEEVLEDFTEKRFLRAMRNIREDYGQYVSRQYLGRINNGHYSEPAGKFPGKVRHVWRGVFEKQERFITMGIYTRDGVSFVHGILFW